MITEHAVRGFDDIKSRSLRRSAPRTTSVATVAFHPHSGCLVPYHEDLETNLMSRNSLTWDHCKDSSSQVPRSPDVQNSELRLVEHSYVKTAVDESHELY